ETDSVVHKWDFNAFKHLLIDSGRRISASTLGFYENWWNLVSDNPHSISLREASQLLSQREWETKQSRARLHNAGARDNWSGGVGMFDLTYNWVVMRRMVNDIQQGTSHVTAR